MPIIGTMGTQTTRKKAAILAFMGLFLLLQIVYSLGSINAPFPTRYAWQMFSRTPAKRFFVLEGPGIHLRVNAGKLLGNERGDIDLEQDYPPFACRAHPQIDRVRWISAYGAEKEFRCR